MTGCMGTIGRAINGGCDQLQVVLMFDGLEENVSIANQCLPPCIGSPIKIGLYQCVAYSDRIQIRNYYFQFGNIGSVVDKLRCIEVFIEVAQSLSFSAAAQRLGMARGNVSKHVAWLEQALGAQLLTRTTKSVALTEAGLSLLENGQDLMERIESIGVAVRLSVKTPKGVLRIGTPPSFGAVHLVPAITAFLAVHPDIQVSVYFDYGESDLVTEGLDMSVRISSSLKDTSQVAYRLAVVPQLLVASPAYVSQHEPIRTVADLSRHNCLVHVLKSPTNSWGFSGPDGNISVRVRGTVRSTFGEALRHAALLGHGIAMHPTYMVANDLKEGLLKVVLPIYRPTELAISGVIPARKNLPLRVRMFLDFLIDWFSAPNWESKDASILRTT